jgi:hypothetical protein
VRVSVAYQQTQNRVLEVAAEIDAETAVSSSDWVVALNRQRQ